MEEWLVSVCEVFDFVALGLLARVDFFEPLVFAALPEEERSL